MRLPIGILPGEITIRDQLIDDDDRRHVLRVARPRTIGRAATAFSSFENNSRVTTFISAEGNLPGSGSGAPSGTKEVCHPVMSGGFEASATFSHAGQARTTFPCSAVRKIQDLLLDRSNSAPADRCARRARDADRTRARAPLALAKLFKTKPAALRSTSVSATSAIDEQIARAARAGRVGASMSAGFQSELNVGARSMPGGPEAKEKTA